MKCEKNDNDNKKQCEIMLFLGFISDCEKGFLFLVVLID